jgi:hypothetical protein
MWQHWTNAVIALVIFVSLFVGLSASTLAWTVGILAAVIAILAFWGAGSVSSEMHSHGSHNMRHA